jgi:hypothetical protein
MHHVVLIMIPEIDEEKKENSGFTEQFIEDYIHTQKARIESRKLIEEMIFFVSCQVASASLALLLFQFAVEIVFTSWLCLFIAWIPSLSALTEVNFHKTEEGWTLKIMNRPLTTIIKFVTGVGITTVTILNIQNEIQTTNQFILDVYADIKKYETPKPQDFLPPFALQALLASVVIVCLLAIIKSLKGKDGL